jgi:hypothetical protein
LTIAKDFTVFEGGAFSYQYGSWSAASDGFAAKKRNTNKQIFMITTVPSWFVKRWKLLHEQ